MLYIFRGFIGLIHIVAALAAGFKITDGNVTVVVPDVEPSDEYVVVCE